MNSNAISNSHTLSTHFADNLSFLDGLSSPQLEIHTPFKRVVDELIHFTDWGNNWYNKPNLLTGSTQPNLAGSQIACSPDGQHVVVTAVDGYYESFDGGNTWKRKVISPTTYQNNWSGIAFSRTEDGVNGKIMVGARGTQSVALVQSWDGGASWFASAPAGGGGCSKVWMNARGTVMFGIRQGGTLPLYLSHDWGQTWYNNFTPSRLYWDLACSDDGMFVIVASNFGLWRSYNGAQTLDAVTVPSGTAAIYRVGMSKDGKHILYGTNTRKWYVSHDGGNTWKLVVDRTGYGGVPSGISVSPTGQFMVCTTSNGGGAGGAFVSNDFGETWYQTLVGDYNCLENCISDDAKHVYTVATLLPSLHRVIAMDAVV